MALPATGVYEVRATGDDTNGGGFVHAGTGTDWTQQDAAQYSVTDAVTAGSTTVTSATANFGTDVVDNYARISGGTGSVVANDYRIVSRTNSTTIVVDRSTGLTAGTGCTLKIGGAKASIQAAMDTWVSGNRIWVKNGAYSVGTNITKTAVNSLPNAVPNMILGYNSTRGDNPTSTTRPTLTATGAIDIMTITDNNVIVGNIIFDCNNTGTRGLRFTGSNVERGTRAIHCSARNYVTSGLMTSLTSIWIGCDVTGGNASSGPAFRGGGTFYGCVARANAATGFSNDTSSAVYIRCISASNTGASSDGWDFDSNLLTYGAMFGCVAYGNGRSGIRLRGTYQALQVLSCILESNAAYGIDASIAYAIASQTFNYNAFYDDTRNNLVAGANDVTLSGSAFTNAASGDFSLNNTAGAGALARATGFPGVFPGGLTTGYLDIGAAQHQDSGGAGGGGPLVGGRLVVV